MERLAIDLLAPELYGGDPYPTYAWMRANEPIYWDEVNELWGISAEPPSRQRHHWP
jgi:hypothetical protein